MDEETRKSKCNIKLFNGDKYSILKFRIRALIAEEDALQVLDENLPNNIIDEWRKHERIAKAIKRKSKEIVKVSLCRRTNRCLKFRTKEPLAFLVPTRTSKSSTHVSDLPNEVPVKIFSHFSMKEMFYCVRLVCRRWKLLPMTFWKEIEIQNEVYTDVLTTWIKSASLLKNFFMKNRNSRKVITEKLSRSCKHLESIKVQNFWGLSRSCLIHSKPVCNLVTRCPKLYDFNFNQIRFMSQKSFRLISRYKRSGKIMKKCNYIGPVTAKQMRALFSALRDYELHEE